MILSNDTAGVEFQLSLLRIAFAGDPPSLQADELGRLLATGYRPQPAH